MKPGSGTSSAVAAISSVVAAITCCLPVGAVWMAAGLAGVSAVVTPLRPYLLAIAVAAVVFGFWQGRRARACGIRRSRASVALLWTAAALTGASVFFPDRIAAFVAGGTGGKPGQAPRAFDASAFERQFDEAAGGTRVVVLLSPT